MKANTEETIELIDTTYPSSINEYHTRYMPLLMQYANFRKFVNGDRRLDFIVTCLKQLKHKNIKQYSDPVIVALVCIAGEILYCHEIKKRCITRLVMFIKQNILTLEHSG